MKVAFYKGTRPGFQGIFNRLVRWWTRSPYSHAELVFSDGTCASSSFIDGGVRFKRINLHPSQSNILDSLRYWAGEVRALGLDTLEGCKRVINTPGR